MDDLWIQPRVAPLPLFVGGLTKDVDGPTFDHSPAGDVAFHAIRAYQPGDDARHVHWMATARAGEMMVRHYVDNRQPFVSVLLDTDTGSWANVEEFDLGVEMAASVGVSSVESAQPGSVFAGVNQLLGSQRRSTRQLLLDDLTLVERVERFDLPDAMGPLIAGERNTTVAVIVIGSRRPGAELVVPAARLATTCSVIVVRVTADHGDESAVVAGRGIRYVEAADLDDFVLAMSGRAVAA